MSKSNIDKTYRKLTDVEHVLHRPSMYIGSVKAHHGTRHLYDGEKIYKSKIMYNPGFLKLFDEIISNSVDEHKRSGKLNEIRVTVNLDNNEISVWDNGGIPVVKHSVHKEWIPEMIFSNMKAGSNFNDSERRVVAGTNGVGSTLTNIYSKRFEINTCDGKKKFNQVFQNNMAKRSKPKISDAKRGFTEITYITDFSQFNMTGIDEMSFQLIYKRCLDVAGCNNKLKVKFTYIKNGKKTVEDMKFKSFEDYISLYTDEFYYEDSKDWKIAFAHSQDGFENISFVNSVHTNDGGTHVSYIADQLISHLRELIAKKHKVEVRPNDIRNHLCVFINSTIVNSEFNSQTKEKLVTEQRDFGTNHKVSEKIAKIVLKSEIVEALLDWIEKKKAAEERAELRKLNKNLSKNKIAKLIDAQKKGDRGRCVLGIYEGMSALSAVRKFRDSQTMGAYPLKGKFINVHELPNSKVIQSDDVKGLMASIGLKLGEDPKNLRYGKIYIYTDADPDGNSIAAQLINFFAKYWPELFEQGRIYKVMTPLVVAKKKNQILNFYTNDEFDKWLNKKTTNLNTWTVEYKKGLGALEDDEYEEIIKNPNLVQLKKDREFRDTLEAWFGKDSSLRKEKLLECE